VIGERHGKQVIYELHDQAVFHVEHLRLGAREPVGRRAKAS
jgi:hypothetical protein